MNKSYEKMASILRKLLEENNGFVNVPLDGNRKLVLCYRGVKEEIDDPECDHVFQTLSAGVFRRFEVQSGCKTTYTWMRFTSLDPHEFSSDFQGDFDGLSNQDIEGVAASLVFQKVQRDIRGMRL